MGRSLRTVLGRRRRLGRLGHRLTDLAGAFLGSLGLADDALARAAADPAVSPDVIETLRQLRATATALAKLAGVDVFEGEQGEAPATR